MKFERREQEKPMNDASKQSQSSTKNTPIARKPRNVNGKITDAAELGSIIRKRRKALGYTQIQVAEGCGCSPRFIGELERGVAGGNIKQVIHVCKMLGIDLFAKVRGE